MALLQGLVPFTVVRHGTALLSVPLAALLVLLAAACGGEAANEPTASTEEPTAAAQAITVHRSPTCGCCEGYERYLEEEGFEVESRMMDDTTELKDSLGIPQDMRSCHTSMVNEYFMEGHVPVEAIRKLLEEQPQIDGIALPGMLSGSPGMSGVQAQPLTVYSIVDGETDEFMTP
jgi:hypothetical protein